MGDVAVLTVGDSGDAADGVGHAVAMALAEEPRGVVVNLRSAAGAGAESAVRIHADAAAHAGEWAVPVLLACQNRRVRQALRAQPSSGQVKVTASVPLALAAIVRSTPAPRLSRGLAPHPTAPRAARDFISRALLDWGLVHRIPAAVLVAGELVTNAMLHSRTQIGLSVATHGGAVRIGVRDGTPNLMGPQTAVTDVREGHGHRWDGRRGLLVVAAVSSSWGVLPTAEGGKVVWAVLDDHPQRRVAPDVGVLRTLDSVHPRTAPSPGPAAAQPRTAPTSQMHGQKDIGVSTHVRPRRPTGPPAREDPARGGHLPNSGGPALSTADGVSLGAETAGALTSDVIDELVRAVLDEARVVGTDLPPAAIAQEVRRRVSHLIRARESCPEPAGTTQRPPTRSAPREAL